MSGQINVQEYISAQKRILSELESLENKSFESKTSYIKRLIDVTRPLIENDYYDGVKLQDLASFIQKELLPKHNISYNNSSDYYALFKEDEKREYNSSKSRNKISSLPINKHTGNKIIDRLKQYARAEINQPENSKYTAYFSKIMETSNQTSKQAESLLSKLGKAYFFIGKFNETFPNEQDFMKLKEQNKKSKDLSELYDFYESCKSTILSIESINNLELKITELDEIIAEQRFVSKQIDERNKITFLEKWNSIVANIELGISAIAKKLSVNKKHLTNNVRPVQNPVTQVKNMHHEYIDWFTHLQVRTPNGETFTFDAKDYFDKQIERGKLNLKFNQLVLKNCDVE